jgi:hypothetical protein
MNQPEGGLESAFQSFKTFKPFKSLSEEDSELEY